MGNVHVPLNLKLPTRCSLHAIARIFLGVVFIWACRDKILDPEAFARAIGNYHIVPAMAGNLAALILPWIELVCGICLIINRWTRGSALIVSALMVVFMGALGYDIYMGVDVSCGCFTLDEQAPGNMWLYLARDAVFLAVAIIVMGRPRPQPHLSGPS
jgi:uncharacterized membrane protein YphA (DoxX/SURF4 family)